MRKLFLTAGSLALICSALKAAYAPGLTPMETAKPWSLSASIRGFYDDNYTTLPKTIITASGPAPGARSSFGFEVSPSAAINLPYEQTFISLGYVYSLKYYENRVHLNQASADHTHQFNGRINHAFNERYSMEFADQFVIAQEPEILNANTTPGVPLRLNGNNIRNTADGTFNAQITQEVSAQVTYENGYYDYEAEPYSTSLDRVENWAGLNLRYQWQRPTTVLLGYQFGYVDYLQNGILPGTTASAKTRSNRQHKLFVGIDHNFNTQLNASLRVGAQYASYFSGATDLGPYANASLTYTYAPGSSLQAGVTHTRNASDITTILDQESTIGYLSLTHRITSTITANLLGQYQHAEYNQESGGGLPGAKGADDYFVASVNIAYRIDQAGHWIAETGYNYDKLSSDAKTFGVDNRSYDRNRVYIGVRATY